MLKRTILAIALGVSCATAWADENEVMEGLPEHLIYLYTNPTDANEAPGAQRQLVAAGRRWDAGRTLRVCTFGGNRVVASLIRKTAIEWNNYSSIKLDFGPEPGGYNCLSPTTGFFQVRIGFSAQGYWSVLGSDSETRLDPLVPSMNLESFNTIYSDARYSVSNVYEAADKYHKAVILHEFGHALALLHEHQSPALDCQSQIKWDGPDNVYEYYGRPPNNWKDPQQVKRNLGYISQTDPDYVVGEPDLASIMMYALPAAIFKKTADGKPNRCAVPVNYTISKKDKEILARIYPTAGSIPQLPIDVGLANAPNEAIPALAPAYNQADMISRALTDLSSDDTYIRRNARIRLSALFQNDAKEEDRARIIAKMPGASYRFQLGVSSALANAPAIRLDPKSRKTLSTLERATSDNTLRESLKAANK